MRTKAQLIADLPKDLPGPATEKLTALLDLLYATPFVRSVMLGGSQSYDPGRVQADSDLFILVKESAAAEQYVAAACAGLPYFDALICQGQFPWTGQLYTAYFKDDADYAIDLCIIESGIAEEFFWEPDGILLIDKSGLLASIRRRQYADASFTMQPFNRPNPFTLATMTYKKIEKNLVRGHLWNALELLAIMRRYYIQIRRSGLPGLQGYLGRPERDLEDVFSPQENRMLAGTAASYDPIDIAEKSMLLAKLLAEETQRVQLNDESTFGPWIDRQIQYVTHKLEEFIRCIPRNISIS